MCSRRALGLGTVVLALTIEDRERLLWALDDARTDALAELRAVPTLRGRDFGRRDSELASYLRIEERELQAGGLT